MSPPTIAARAPYTGCVAINRRRRRKLRRFLPDLGSLWGRGGRWSDQPRPLCARRGTQGGLYLVYAAVREWAGVNGRFSVACARAQTSRLCRLL